MRHLVMSILFLFGIILQSTLFPHLSIAGVKPDLVLVFVVFYAMLQGPKEGARAGLVGGLLQDILFGQNLGMNIMAKLTTGYLFGFLERRIYKKNLIIPMITVFVATFLNETILYLFRLAVGTSTGYLISIRSIIVIAAIYNSLLSLFMYRRFYISAHKGLLRITGR